MEITIFLARFWGSLFMLLGLQSVCANLLGRTIKMTEERAITIVAWATLLNGIITEGFPEHVNKQAQIFKRVEF